MVGVSLVIVNRKFSKIKYIIESNTVKNMKMMILAFLQPTRSECVRVEPLISPLPPSPFQFYQLLPHNLIYKFVSTIHDIRLMDLKGHIDCSDGSKKSSRRGRTRKMRSFQENLILSFCCNDKHEKQHVGQMISIKGHII